VRETRHAARGNAFRCKSALVQHVERECLGSGDVNAVPAVRCSGEGQKEFSIYPMAWPANLQPCGRYRSELVCVLSLSTVLGLNASQHMTSSL
jgi:hypothetical protein